MSVEHDMLNIIVNTHGAFLSGSMSDQVGASIAMILTVKDYVCVIAIWIDVYLLCTEKRHFLLIDITSSIN